MTYLEIGHEPKEVPLNGRLSLEEAQKMVGGWVEVLYLRAGKIMLINEEGRPMNLPLNPLATIVAGRVIVGNAIICDNCEF